MCPDGCGWTEWENRHLLLKRSRQRGGKISQNGEFGQNGKFGQNGEFGQNGKFGQNGGVWSEW